MIASFAGWSRGGKERWHYMKIIERTVAAPVARPSMLRRLMGLRAVAMVLAFVGAPVVFAGVASATPPDPTGGAGTDFITGLTTWVTTYGVPIVFGLLLLAITIRVAVKYAKRGASSL